MVGGPFEASGLSFWDAATLRRLPRSEYELVVSEMNRLAFASAQAQGLCQVITSLDKIERDNHRLYMFAMGGVAVGMLRVGIKRLFLRDTLLQLRECSPLCVLDFFVEECSRRRGVGKQLFDCMLKSEGSPAECLAYDRPSPKLLAFLKRHFKLSQSPPQDNNFVAFDSFFNHLVNIKTPLRPGGATLSAAPSPQTTPTRSIRPSPSYSTTTVKNCESVDSPWGGSLKQSMSGKGQGLFSTYREGSESPPPLFVMTNHRLLSPDRRQRFADASAEGMSPHLLSDP